MSARRVPLFAVIPQLAAILLSGAALSGTTQASDLRAEGEKQFIRCVSCHSMDAADEWAVGPHLRGIVGRPVAGLPDFNYTEELRQKILVWDEAQLDAWLSKPQELVPGMCLPFMGLPNADHRAALIEYLKTAEQVVQ